jgi:hypothetical protein
LLERVRRVIGITFVTVTGVPPAFRDFTGQTIGTPWCRSTRGRAR